VGCIPFSLAGTSTSRHGPCPVPVRISVGSAREGPMSWYQMHRAVYDWVRAGEVNSADGGDGRAGCDVSAYELTDEERKAFDNRDIAALYKLGLHEVLLNRFCRAAGFARDDYRKILAPFGEKEQRRARWQK
jgi:hypothetical protein